MGYVSSDRASEAAERSRGGMAGVEEAGTGAAAGRDELQGSQEDKVDVEPVGCCCCCCCCCCRCRDADTLGFTSGLAFASSCSISQNFWTSRSALSDGLGAAGGLAARGGGGRSFVLGGAAAAGEAAALDCQNQPIVDGGLYIVIACREGSSRSRLREA